MRVRDLDPTPWRELPYLDAGRAGAIERRALPVLRGRVDGLPRGLDALIVASDLQGREVPRAGTPPRLLGEALADALDDWEADLPPPARTGVLLAGDLFVDEALAERGGLGDVRAVWRALARDRRWVAGVAGNHDAFGDPREQARFEREPGVHLLDGEVRALDGLRVGGVGGIPGNPRRPQRKPPEAYLEAVVRVLDARPDVLVLHPPPVVPGGRRGEPLVSEALAVAGRGLLVVCGHAHWPEPLHALGPHQVLNVDGRVVVLEGGASSRLTDPRATMSS